MLSFYGGQQGTGVNLKAIFRNRAEDMLRDLRSRWYSPINVGEYVLISYGDPSYNRQHNSGSIETTTPTSSIVKDPETGKNIVVYPRSHKLFKEKEYQDMLDPEIFGMLLEYGRRYIVRYDDEIYYCDCKHNYVGEEYNYLGNIYIVNSTGIYNTKEPFVIRNNKDNLSFSIATATSGNHSFSISRIKENANQNYDKNLNIDLSKMGKSYNGSVWQKIYADKNFKVQPELPLNDENVYVFLKPINTNVASFVVRLDTAKTTSVNPVSFDPTERVFYCNSYQVFKENFFYEVEQLNDPVALSVMYGPRKQPPLPEESLFIQWVNNASVSEEDKSTTYRVNFLASENYDADLKVDNRWRFEDTHGKDTEYTTQDLTIRGENASLIVADEDFGFGYRLITQLSGVTPRIQLKSTAIDIETGDPKAEVNLENPDEPLITLQLQRAQSLNDVSTEITHSEEDPSAIFYTDLSQSYGKNMLVPLTSLLGKVISQEGISLTVNPDSSITISGSNTVTEGKEIFFPLKQAMNLLYNKVYGLQLLPKDDKNIEDIQNLSLYLKLDDILFATGKKVNARISRGYISNEVGIRIITPADFSIPLTVIPRFSIGASVTNPSLKFILPKAKEFFNTELLGYNEVNKITLTTVTPKYKPAKVLNEITMTENISKIGLFDESNSTVFYCNTNDINTVGPLLNAPENHYYVMGNDSIPYPVGDKECIIINFETLNIESSEPNRFKYQKTKRYRAFRDTSGNWTFENIDTVETLSTEPPEAGLIKPHSEQQIKDFKNLYQNVALNDYVLSNITKAIFKVTTIDSSIVSTQENITSKKILGFLYIDTLTAPSPTAEYEVTRPAFSKQTGVYKPNEITVSSEIKDDQGIPKQQTFKFNFPKEPLTEVRYNLLPSYSNPSVKYEIKDENTENFVFNLAYPIQLLTAQNSNVRLTQTVNGPEFTETSSGQFIARQGDYFLHFSDDYKDPDRGRVFQRQAGKNVWKPCGNLLGPSFVSHAINEINVLENSALGRNTVVYRENTNTFEVDSTITLEKGFFEKALALNDPSNNKVKIALFGSVDFPKFGESILITQRLLGHDEINATYRGYYFKDHYQYIGGVKTLDEWAISKTTGSAAIANNFNVSNNQSYSTSYINSLFVNENKAQVSQKAASYTAAAVDAILSSTYATKASLKSLSDKIDKTADNIEWGKF